MGQCNSAEPAPVGSGKVIIYGMDVSGNVIPPTLFCLDHKCGGMEMMNIMAGEQNTPEKLALNPFHQMPIMVDGDFSLAESNAILRYLAKVYSPKTYGLDVQAQATIDWALDWAATNFSNNYKDIWYPVAGFGPPPEDQGAANQKAVENLDTFAKKFLPEGKKFIGGSILSIADYKIGTLIWYIDHPTIDKKLGYKNPERLSQYAKDWYAALSDESKKFLEGGKGFMDSKA
eukprot:CAMPEP_0179042142 /NCGR_PEP_ID=MMETSP0796-20121207/16515_1 /TAXON_ID=73915 /ORGANISM="Pyrodinium bahamense, Strain pbaha01" /LENGTH=230 /DNA_ID=CAMNT_0020738519 /DNA_START=81 /DNA_END=776 /DNA_ORIENTATION=+